MYVLSLKPQDEAPGSRGGVCPLVTANKYRDFFFFFFKGQINKHPPPSVKVFTVKGS